MEEKKNKLYKSIMLVVLTAFITFMITAFWICSYYNGSQEASFSVSSLLDGLTSSGNSNVDSYLSKVKRIIDKYYLWKNDINEDDLKEGAIKGYIAALGDDYTEYVPTDEMDEYTENITGNFVGIGIYMIKDESTNKIVVYYPIPGSPAEEVGIKSGDIILRVNGTEYSGDDFENISSYIKGEEGTTVNIVIQRGEQELTFDIKRKKVNILMLCLRINFIARDR